MYLSIIFSLRNSNYCIQYKSDFSHNFGTISDERVQYKIFKSIIAKVLDMQTLPPDSECKIFS